MTSPLEQSYGRPRLPQPLEAWPENRPAAIYARRERESRARAMSRRVELLLAVDEAEAIVRGQGS